MFNYDTVEKSLKRFCRNVISHTTINIEPVFKSNKNKTPNLPKQKKWNSNQKLLCFL